MYRGTKPRSLISIAILIIFILPTNPLKACAHASAEINNVLSDKGHVVLYLYENKTSFKKFNPDRIYKKVATMGTTIIPIDDYHEGDVAIFVFHDENSDEEFNTSIFWTPKKVMLIVIHIFQQAFQNMRRRSFTLSMELQLI